MIYINNKNKKIKLNQQQLNERQELLKSIELQLKEDGILLLFYALTYVNLITKKEVRELFTAYGYRELDFNRVFDMAIREEAIAIVEYKKEINTTNTIYLKLTNKGKDMIVSANKYKTLVKLLELKDIYKKKQCIVIDNDVEDSYTKAINIHHNIEHFHCIYTLYNICKKENIVVEDVYKQISANVAKDLRVFRYKNYRRAEADLSIVYNRKTLFIEVERGNTNKEDMYDKLTKYQSLDRTNQPKMDVVIIAAPNKKDLDATRKKVKEWEEKYDYDYSVGNVHILRDLKFIYLNISDINSKKTLRKFLFNSFKNKKT